MDCASSCSMFTHQKKSKGNTCTCFALTSLMAVFYGGGQRVFHSSLSTICVEENHTIVPCFLFTWGSRAYCRKATVVSVNSFNLMLWCHHWQNKVFVFLKTDSKIVEFYKWMDRKDIWQCEEGRLGTDRVSFPFITYIIIQDQKWEPTRNIFRRTLINNLVFFLVVITSWWQRRNSASSYWRG